MVSFDGVLVLVRYSMLGSGGHLHCIQFSVVNRCHEMLWFKSLDGSRHEVEQ